METPNSTESNRHGTKGTAHTRFNEICAKATVIALASFELGHLKKKTKKKHSVEKCWNRTAKYSERLRTQAFVSLEGFRMYVHYGHVSAIPI